MWRIRLRRLFLPAVVVPATLIVNGCCTLERCQEKGQEPLVVIDPRGVAEHPDTDTYLSKKLNQQITWVFLDGKNRNVVVTVASGQPVPFAGMTCNDLTPKQCTIACPPGQVCRSGQVGDFTPPKKGLVYNYELVVVGGSPGGDPRFIIKP